MNRAERRRQARAKSVVPSAPPAGPTISACLIVKDEAANLDRCLRSLKGKVDEVIVVDTGSTDESMEVARKHGARVSSFAWCDDFAAARNASIDQAQGDWVIWVDADEELMEDPPGAIRQLCQRPEQPEGFLVTCRNMINTKGDVNSEIRQWRLFRNHLGLRFHGRIHEHLLHADGSTESYLLFQDALWIRHWGYMPEPALMARKKTRNLKLLEIALEDDPSDPFMHYNLGKQHSAHHEFAQALPELEKAVELWRGRGGIAHAYVGNMFALVINSAVELGLNQRAIELEALVPDAVLSPDILFQAGVAWMRLGQREEGRRRLLRAWQDTSIRMHIEGDPSSYTWRPLAALAQMHLDSGEAEQAYDYARQALPYAPDLPNLLWAMALTSARLKRMDECLVHARKLISLDVYEHYKEQARRLLLNIGQGTNRSELVLEAFSGRIEGISDDEGVLIKATAFQQLGQLQQQYEALDAGCRAYPENFGIRLALADVLETQGYLAEATNVLGAGLDQPQPPPAFYARLARLLAQQGQLEDAANALAVQQGLVQQG